MEPNPDKKCVSESPPLKRRCPDPPRDPEQSPQRSPSLQPEQTFPMFKIEAHSPPPVLNQQDQPVLNRTNNNDITPFSTDGKSGQNPSSK